MKKLNLIFKQKLKLFKNFIIKQLDIIEHNKTIQDKEDIDLLKSSLSMLKIQIEKVKEVIDIINEDDMNKYYQNNENIKENVSIINSNSIDIENNYEYKIEPKENILEQKLKRLETCNIMKDNLFDINNKNIELSEYNYQMTIENKNINEINSTVTQRFGKDWSNIYKEFYNDNILFSKNSEFSNSIYQLLNNKNDIRKSLNLKTNLNITPEIIDNTVEKYIKYLFNSNIISESSYIFHLQNNQNNNLENIFDNFILKTNFKNIKYLFADNERKSSFVRNIIFNYQNFVNKPIMFIEGFDFDQKYQPLLHIHFKESIQIKSIIQTWSLQISDIQKKQNNENYDKLNKNLSQIYQNKNGQQIDKLFIMIRQFQIERNKFKDYEKQIANLVKMYIVWICFDFEIIENIYLKWVDRQNNLLDVYKSQANELSIENQKQFCETLQKTAIKDPINQSILAGIFSQKSIPTKTDGNSFRSNYQQLWNLNYQAKPYQNPIEMFCKEKQLGNVEFNELFSRYPLRLKQLLQVEKILLMPATQILGGKMNYNVGTKDISCLINNFKDRIKILAYILTEDDHPFNNTNIEDWNFQEFKKYVLEIKEVKSYVQKYGQNEDNKIFQALK